MKFNSDTWAPTDFELTIREPRQDESKIGSNPVLAVVEGPHFVPNGQSRNGRFYEKQLWDNVLGRDDVKEKLSRKLVFGTIGHPKDWDAEKYMREGLVSHITETMWIDNSTGLGYARDLVLDTPAGRALNTYLRAGSKPFTSSRAYGEILTGRKVDDLPVVNPDNYEFEGFDYVLNPGFLKAQPQLKEALDSERILLTELKEDDGGFVMDEFKKMVETLTSEKLSLERTISEMLDSLNGYKEFGTPKQIDMALSEAKKVIEDLRSRKISESSKIGNQIKVYEELGTVTEIEQVLEVAKKQHTVISRYKKLGKPEEIEEALDKAKEIAISMKKDRMRKKVTEFARKYDMPETAVKTMVEEIGNLERVETILKNIKEGRKYTPKPRVDEKGVPITEKENTIFSKLVRTR